jgi:glycine dehydrogenase subunit 1
VPSVVDTIISRGEFLTAYYGTNYSDMGRFQVMFEYVSMLTDLVGMEVAGFPMYDGSSSGGTALRMSARITGRPEILLPETVSPLRMKVIENYCTNSEVKTIHRVSCHPDTGLVDLDDVKAKLTPNTAGVYIENPSYLGMIETQGARIADLAHANGSLFAVGVNPMSLGVLAPPGDYGADIVSGDTQPLGVHMNYGGGTCGFVAVRDVEEHIAELPPLMTSIADLTALWSTANAVYMALMGPQGMKDIGETILQKSHYAKNLISEIPGLKAPFPSAHFNEFVVSFDETGKTVSQINAALLKRKIFGGKDLSEEFPHLGQSALYCISEIHTAKDLKKLAKSLKEVIA